MEAASKRLVNATVAHDRWHAHTIYIWTQTQTVLFCSVSEIAQGREGERGGALESQHSTFNTLSCCSLRHFVLRAYLVHDF